MEQRTLKELIASGRIVVEESRRVVRVFRRGLEELRRDNLAMKSATEQVRIGFFLADLDETGIRLSQQRSVSSLASNTVRWRSGWRPSLR